MPIGRRKYRGPGESKIAISTTTTAAPSNGSSVSSNGAATRPTFNKLNFPRRRGGRPSTPTPAKSEESQETTHPEAGQSTPEIATNTAKSTVRGRLPSIRPTIRPVGKVNLRQKPGQTTTTTTLSPESAELSVEEPAGEGTEEEGHEVGA